MFKPIAALTLATVAAATASTAAQAHPPGDRQLEPMTSEQVREARRATRRFKDVDVARKAGYAKASACEDDPKYGGMGLHYSNQALIEDGRLDVTRPEVLVYQPTRGGKLRLGAVEYLLLDGDQDLATDPDRPSLFGLPFDGPMLGHNPQMPIHYDLHAWLYRHNPAGMFAMWNPTVHCP
jgi:hypothetical protein